MIVTCIVALGICLPVFAAEPAVAAGPGTTVLTNPRFVKDSGDKLALGMGTGVVEPSQCTIDEAGNITVQLKTLALHSHFGDLFSGSIIEARFIDANGTVQDRNLVRNGQLKLKSNQVSEMPKNGNGIHLQLTFDMNPLPPGMSEVMNAYFTYDNMPLPQGN